MKKIYNIVLMIMGILSLIFVVVYQMKLSKIAINDYNTMYLALYDLVAIPLLALALSGIATEIFIKMFLKPISKKLKIVFLIAAFVILILYIVLTAIQLTVGLSGFVFYMKLNKGYIAIVVGVLFSLGVMTTNLEVAHFSSRKMQP